MYTDYYNKISVIIKAKIEIQRILTTVKGKVVFDHKEL